LFIKKPQDKLVFESAKLALRKRPFSDKSGPFPDRDLPDLLFWNEVRFGRKGDLLDVPRF
jgi:hypothetical protein